MVEVVVGFGVVVDVVVGLGVVGAGVVVVAFFSSLSPKKCSGIQAPLHLVRSAGIEPALWD